jgi:hypothetical protein
VPIFKWGNVRSKVVANPLLQTVVVSFGATEESGALRRSLEALKRNVGVLLKSDIPGYQRPSPDDFGAGIGDGY